MLYFLFRCHSPVVFFSSPRHAYPPSSSATAAAASHSPDGSIPSCSHHRILTCALGALSDPSHRSNIDRVSIYCATVFWRRLTYSSIVKKPAASLATAAKFYFHVPSVFLHRSFPVSRLANWVRNPPRSVPMQGVNTQVSALKSSTACIADLKNNPETRGVAPSLLRICDILLHTEPQYKVVFI